VSVNAIMNKAGLILLVVVLLLVAVGVVMLFSTSAIYARERYNDPHFLLKRQLVWSAIAGLVCVVAASTPYPKLRSVSFVMLIGAMLLLLLVFVPKIGLSIGGSRRWLDIFGQRVQPSEFAKYALVTWLAYWLAREKRRLDQFKRGFLIPMGVTGAVLALILVEPDYGCTALLGSVALGMMFVAGVRLRYLVPSVLLGGAGFGALIMRNPERFERLMAFMDLDKYKASEGYQVWQAMLAFGSGGIDGLGLGNGRQKMFYLPEAHTDFIFPIIGEELGLIGTSAILLAFVVIVAAGLYISAKAQDPFGQFLGLGITLLIALQAIINIGVVTAWLPTKGLALPFISYGGSSMVMNMVGVGILLSIYRYGTVESVGVETDVFARQSMVT
jgi:cell division protein FtsW